MEVFASVFGGFLPVPARLKTAFAEKTARENVGIFIAI
jgi:hypothetical protein